MTIEQVLDRIASLKRTPNDVNRLKIFKLIQKLKKLEKTQLEKEKK